MKINVFKSILRFLQKPSRVLALCLILAGCNIILDGSFFQMRKLYLNKKNLNHKIEEIQKKNQVLLKKLNNLSNPRHLEKEARERFDLAEQGDLIFIFPEDE